MLTITQDKIEKDFKVALAGAVVAKRPLCKCHCALERYFFIKDGKLNSVMFPYTIVSISDGS